MVLRVPFRRWVLVNHRNPQPVHGGFYCLLPIQGRRVVAAVTRYQRSVQTSGNFVTAYQPSTIQQNLPLMKSGYWCMPQTIHLRDFQSRVQSVLEDLNLEVISVRMGNRTWSITVDNGHLNGAMFNQLLDALQLQLYDYVFITMLPNLDVRVVVLDATNDRERIYDWL
ncbi:hypothetical protein RHGRI_023888 [Rhododendron griersonianum]|uniref:Uncharacterized protein n=1 Tax=Rhododendron griersonianum TaxID=479676 RepID=A0AAV6J5I9_9ERIC|nr:hypothetical protein RHGRI_023888 [Rhododendron griersonianum]